jgi:galactitol-specific phosphotransferase system IIC component
MTATQLSTISAIVLSLVFSYIPGIKEAWDQQNGIQKRIYMLLCLVIVTGASFGLACLPMFANLVNIQCTQAGAVALFTAFIQAMIANQATFLISPQPKPAEPVKVDPEMWRNPR